VVKFIKQLKVGIFLKKPLVNYIRTGFLAGLLVAVTIANFMDLNMILWCAIGLFGGAGIGAIWGLIARAKK